jgi:dTDP-4-dehydrorhamnose reductase
VWSYNFILPSFFVAWYFVQHRDKFALTCIQLAQNKDELKNFCVNDYASSGSVTGNILNSSMNTCTT